MRLPLACMTFAMFAGAAGAQTPDPLQSPECRKAIDALQAEEAASAAHPGAAVPGASAAPAIPPRLAALRRTAARACLGTHADTLPAPQRPLQPPVSVQRAPLLPPPAAPRLPVPAVPLPPEPTRPAFVTSCDAGGCWASDGTRLPRAGPNLIGPRGLCTQHGALLSCP